MKTSEEFDNFDRTMRDLISVPHEEIKAELEAEKAKKTNRRRNTPAEQPATRKADHQK
jgi:hypothetical protein